MFDNWHDYGQSKKRYFTDLIDQYGPYRFMVTLSFQRRLSEECGISLADRYWRRTTKKIFEAKTRDPVTSITGCGVLEKARVTDNPSHEKNCHFHFLINNHPVFSLDEGEAIAQLETASWKVVRNFKTSAGYALVSEGDKGVHVQSVYSDGVNVYLGKQAIGKWWRQEERFFFLDKQGLIAPSPAVGDAMFH